MSKNYLQQREEFVKEVKKKEDQLAKLNQELVNLEERINELEKGKNRITEQNQLKEFNEKINDLNEKVQCVKNKINITESEPIFADSKIKELTGGAYSHCDSEYKSLLKDYISSSKSIVTKGENVFREIRATENMVNELLPSSQKMGMYPDTVQFNATINRLKNDIERINRWLEM